jgi:hypothetical protein
MGAVYKMVSTVFVASLFSGMATNLAAEELPIPPAQILDSAAMNMPANQQVAALPISGAPSKINQLGGPQLKADGLHKDPRWPQFQNCIDNTYSPQAFAACLQQAFRSDMTGAGPALLPQ